MENKSTDITTSIGNKWKEGDTMDWDKICFVRALNKGWEQLQVKEINGEKRIICQSALNSTRGEIPRLTVHWALNHRVERHLYGSWDEAFITIIAPGESTIAENGKPLSLYAVDSFWSEDVVIPENSTIIYSGNIPSEFLDVKANFVKSPVETDEIQKAHELENAYEKKLKEGKVEESHKLEAEYFRTTSEIAKRVNRVVNEKIEEMGYTVFEGDNGIYMHMPELDHAVHSLVKKEGLNTFIHADSAMNRLEDPTLTLAMVDPDLLFEKKNNYTEYSSAIQDMRTVMKDINEENPKYDKDAINVFCAELYNIFKKHPDRVLNDNWGLRATIIFFDENPEIRDTIIKWMEKDHSEIKDFKDLTSVIKILNLDNCKEVIEKWCDEGDHELVIEKTIKDADINLISNLLKDYLIDKYEVFMDVEAKPAGDNTYKFHFS